AGARPPDHREDGAGGVGEEAAGRVLMKKIVMLGSALDVRGGVSAMVRVYVEQGLFARCGVDYLATHCDGSKARKLLQAARAWVAFMARLLTGRIALLHVHLSSDSSFWRKTGFIVPAHALG